MFLSRTLSVLSLALILSSCGAKGEKCTTCSDCAYFQEEKAPIVSLFPVIDNSDHLLPWDLSKEFTTALQKNLAKNGALLIEKPLNASNIPNPFGSETAWVKDIAPGSDYLVFVEVGEHSNLPQAANGDVKWGAADSLKMMARIRAFDLSGTAPKIILQEVFTESEDLKLRVNDTESGIRPIGLSHKKLTEAIAAQVEDYILLNEKAKNE